MTDQDPESLANRLNEHPDFRVLRRLQPTNTFVADSDEHKVRKALIVDVETTGISKTDDSIIELGMVLFSYDITTGQVIRVLASESFLEDPGVPLSPEIVALTGINDEMLKDQHIPDSRVLELLSDVGIVIAHNASFDRPFIERRFPAFRDVYWGCSQRDIDWRSMGMSSMALEFLVYKHLGMFFNGHRASDDCRATLELIAKPFADGSIPLTQLRKNCLVKRIRICALSSPFETKDLLRSRGYRWSGNDGSPARTWCKEIPASEEEQEREWLANNVYPKEVAALVEAVDLKRRWS